MTIYICGDSTAASYTENETPFMGWGQALPALLPGVKVDNQARAGRSSKSFLAEGRLQAIEPLLQPGDLLLIQFAHNDESNLVWRRTEPRGSFLNCLSLYVDTARLWGAVPVLLTPICVRTWLNGKLQPSHGEYPEAVRTLARQRAVPLLDLYRESFRAVKALGEEGSRALYLHVAPGLYPACPEGCADDTHTGKAGAEAFAKMVAEGLQALHLIGG
ncbi:MAG: rhamnogalacturonan acetylesterase [Clostridia bacterium]|nr:rhamnogalacturonan acetylesterase [Clostridia bacterium]